MIPILAIGRDRRKRSKFIKEIAQKLQIGPLNIIEIKPETAQIKIDQIRGLSAFLSRPSADPGIAVVHEFETASEQVQNAFLKTLEEQAGSQLIVLFADDITQILPTIISRCKIESLGDRKNRKLEIATRNKSLGELLQDFSSVSAKKAVSVIDNIIFEYAMVLDSAQKESVEKPLATDILRECFKVRNHIQRHHLNPQLGLDHLFFYIKQSR